MAQVKVYVTLKPSLLDAQGKVVQGSLQQLGHANVASVRVGKYIEMTVADDTHAQAPEEMEKQVRAMCDTLLANPVIEDYRFEVSA
jgi:phosphoribosylformylglycinamidine synthase